jgi:hypothetical protein
MRGWAFHLIRIDRAEGAELGFDNALASRMLQPITT